MNNYCGNCGNRINENDKYCFKCGAPVIKERIDLVEETKKKELEKNNELKFSLSIVGLIIIGYLFGRSEEPILNQFSSYAFLTSFILLIYARVTLKNSTVIKVLFILFIIFLVLCIIMYIVMIISCIAVFNSCTSIG